jgi:hypothetical protein
LREKVVVLVVERARARECRERAGEQSMCAFFPGWNEIFRGRYSLFIKSL